MYPGQVKPKVVSFTQLNVFFPFNFRYDHLSSTLTKILDERPENVYDIFEDISKDTKRSKFTSNVDTVQDKIDQSTEVALAQVQRKLFAVSVTMLI